jgi:hypothetical protein
MVKIMKKQFMKIISLLLVLSTMLSITTTVMTPVMFVSAAESAAEEDRATEEAKEDEKSAFPAGDWKRAKKDNLVPPYNRFHNYVQKYIINNYGNLTSEHQVTFKPGLAPPGNKTGKGRADLYRVVGDNAYFWEVKPGSYLEPSKMGRALIQLSQYVEDTIPEVDIENRLGNTPYFDGKNSEIKGKFSLRDLIAIFGEKLPGVDLEQFEGLDISFDGIYDSSGKYIILIAYLPSGLILYWFIRIPDIDLPKLDPASVPDLSPFWWLFGAPFLQLWKNMMNNPGGGQSPLPAPGYGWNPNPVPANPQVPGEKSNEGGGSNTGGQTHSPKPTWKDGAIVLVTASGVVILVAAHKLGYLKAVAVQLKALAESRLSAEKGRGTVSDKKFVSVSCTAFLAMTNPASSNAESAYRAVKDFEEFLEFYEEYMDLNGDGESGDGYDDPSDPNEDTGEDIEDDVDDAGNTPAPRDPLAVDLGESGITLTSVDNGVYFDLDKNGFAEKTAWIGPEDGFLAFDRNGNGKIDNGGELFGDQVEIDGTGECYPSGFAALAVYDENDDGIIDSADSVFSGLLIWVDSNHNGISESGELKSLEDSRIVSISLDYEEPNHEDAETGTIISRESTVTFNDASTRKISEHWFKVNARDSQDLHDYGDGVIVTSVDSFGNIMSLNNAIFADETGELGRLVDEFKHSGDYVEKRVLVKRILYFITDADGITANSRGGSIDARDLHVIEQFMGRGFIGIDGGTNPNVNAAPILKRAYFKIENMYLNQLNKETEIGYYLTLIFETRNSDEDGKITDRTLDLSLLSRAISNIEDAYKTSRIVSGAASWLLQYDNAFGTGNFSDFKQDFPEYTAYFDIIQNGNVLLGKDGSETVNGASGIDIIRGNSGGNTLNGSSGNDVLYSGTGNDALDGGTGDDSLIGNSGDNTYIFKKGYGKDTVIDYEGTNRIRFTGINASDVSVNGTGFYDVTITVKGTNDSLTIRNFRTEDLWKCFEFEFSGVLLDINAPDSPFRRIYGGNGDDVLQAVAENATMHGFGGDDLVLGSNGDDIVYGNDGNDVIYGVSGNNRLLGGDGNDEIYGGNSNDIIYGGIGSDVLDGDTGNDLLSGGIGNDIYVFRLIMKRI